MTAKKRPIPTRPKLDEAAIAACRAAYGSCACEKARVPEVCRHMWSVAFAVLANAAPAVLKELEASGQAPRPQ